MSFDEYQKSDSAICMHNDFNRKIYEAGAQSRQAEIDELQKRIDEALKELELLDYYRTGNSDNAIKILKGTGK